MVALSVAASTAFSFSSISHFNSNANQDTALDEAEHIVSLLSKSIKELPYSAENKGEANAFLELNQYLNDLSHLRSQYNYSSERDQLLKKFFQESILEMSLESDNCRQCYQQARGYPGDFEMMESIWLGRTIPAVFRYRGLSAIGKYLNAFTLDSANCQANEYRVKYLKKVVSDKKRNYLASVGCGSALELQEVLNHSVETSKVFEQAHLFDQDSGGYESLCRVLKPQHYQKFQYYPGNIFRTALGMEANTYDLIYSLGLFDYLEIDSSKKLVRHLWEKLTPGGELIITNAHPNNPTRLWMEYCANWSLNYKNEQEMLSLATMINPKEEIEDMRVHTDPFGVYQYLRIKKYSP